MEHNAFTELESKVRFMKSRKRWRKIVSLVACLSFAVTISALTLPAISQSDDTHCGYEEHTHSDDCYEIVLQCTASDNSQTEENSTGPPEEASAEITENAEVTTEDSASEETAVSEEVSDAENTTAAEQSHSHTAECYVKNLVCEIPEHIHSRICTSDVTADTETEADWNEAFGLYQKSGVLSVDILSIAQLQLGYKESTENFTVDSEGIVHGYTRYGEWLGAPYAEWKNAFVLFSMEYAEADLFGKNTDTEEWILILKNEENGLFREKDGYIPGEGDLIFFDSDEDGKSDYAGIVSASSSDNKTLTVIEGDVNGEVAEVNYELTDVRITGFGQLTPEEGGGFDTNTFSLVNVSGTQLYHSPDYLEYQYSSHRVNNFMTLTYVLIPYDDYMAGDWEPNLLNWSANSNANYVVAYCADRDTDVSEDGEQYIAQTIYESDYSEYADVLAGIVQHSYPFITEEEMRAALRSAYEAGEISEDLSCCKSSDYIAAVQWAIWDMTRLSGTQTTATSSSFPVYNQEALNPLTDPGHTDAASIQSHVKQIRDWLVTRRAPLPLNVLSHESEISYNSDGTYNLQVTAALSRHLEPLEKIYATFTAGDKVFNKTVADPGTGVVSMELTGLTAEEVVDAKASFTVQFDRLQVYVYDSDNYQDMISGQWGQDKYDLSFDIEVESVSVDVTKHWSDNTAGVSSIAVQLFADGKQYGDTVYLNSDNNWKYTWDELLKYSSEGTEIEYTVSEQLIPGYYSDIEKTEGGTKTVYSLENVTAFNEGGTYVLTYGEFKALSDFTESGGPGLEWTLGLDSSSPEDIPACALWTASGVTALSDSGASAYLKNQATGNYLSYDGSSYITLSSSASAKAYFQYSHLFFLKSNYNQYIIYLNNGLGYTTTVWDSALGVNLYELKKTVVDTADISFVITNTKTEDNTSVSVEKKWEGRKDEVYPESVTVQLLQNGAPYGTPVVLDSSNDWKYVWEDLPHIYGDQIFDYTVSEKEVEGYFASVEKTENEDGTSLFVITNNWNPEYVSLKLQKTDYEDPALMLPGAEFEVYRVVLEGGVDGSVAIPGTAETYGILEQTVVTPDSGEIVLNELLVGATYYLYEAQAPRGYNLMRGPVIFDVGKDADGNAVLTFSSGEDWISTGTDSDGYVLQVKNQLAYILPATGGSGTVPYFLAGILLIVFTAVCFITKTVQNNNKTKRRKKS